MCPGSGAVRADVFHGEMAQWGWCPVVYDAMGAARWKIDASANQTVLGQSLWFHRGSLGSVGFSITWVSSTTAATATTEQAAYTLLKFL